MKKFCFTVILCCFFWFSGPAFGMVKKDHPVFVTKDYLMDYINDHLNDYVTDYVADFVNENKGNWIEGTPEILMKAPVNAKIGQQFINKGSGVLCTLISEIRMGKLYSFWSKDGKQESIECFPANTGTPPRIIFFDPPETKTVYPDVDKRITFKVAFPDAINNYYIGFRPHIIKMYVVDTKTGNVFKTNQYSGISYTHEPFKPSFGGFEYIANDKKLMTYLEMGWEGKPSNLFLTHPGVFDFVIEAIDENNNSSYAAVPINIEYVGFI